VVLPNDTAPAAKRSHRRVELLGQRAHCLARVLCSAAHHEHRPCGGGEQLGGSLHLRGRGRGRFGNGGGTERLDVADRGQRIPGHFDRHCARPARQHLAKRFIEDGRGVGGTLDARSPFGEGTQRCELIGQLVQMAATAAQEGRWYLTRDQQHRCTASVRGANGGGCIEDAGPGHDGEHAWSPRRARVAERHVAAGLLVPRAHGTDAVALLLERVEQRIELGSG
jgi:hypothetical protein